MPTRRSRLVFLAITFLTLAGCATTTPKPKSVIEDRVVSFDRVEATVTALNEKHGAGDVLIVLDIDNTILTSAVDLGGDVWYQWQRGKLNIEPEPDQKVDCLFEDAIGLLYELGPMLLTEEMLPDRIEAWQDRGNTVFALTSRSPKYRAATERELTRMGIDFTRAPLAPKGKKAAVYREMADREWSYMQGVMMTTGMNKATMLETLLARTGRTFSAIVFVDDTRRHIDDMFAAFRDSDRTETRIFHFTKVEAERMASQGAVLTEQQAEKMDSDWRSLNAVLNEIFPARASAEGCLATP
ncbi:MAG: DUF2608 domain-containing protein [Woeseiaceae bacterium]|nr:DUF2608 domain-containing protein [Woeseiaceae bacterium]